jgi:ribose-phosphate pyrophosphokinase
MEKILLCCPEMTILKDRVRDSLDFTMINTEITWNKFPDGSPNTIINSPELIKGNDIYFLACLEKQDEIFRQLSVMYALPHYHARSLTVFLPYFPTATMERVSTPGQIATAKTLMRMLDAIPSCHGTGPTRLITYDIHSLAVQHFHSDGIIVELQSAIPLLLKRAQQGSVFAFPDDGAKKRFHTFFPDPCIICTKDENRIVKIKEGKKLIPHANIVIVDDMCRNGDTLINCAKTLREEGASYLSAYITHGVFPDESWKKLQVTIDKIWVTDSCLVAQDLGFNRIQPFEILSLSSLIAQEISRS